MTPDEKKQLEEYKKKNAEAMAANRKIANLNTMLTAGARGHQGGQLRRGDHGDAERHDGQAG